MNKRVLIFDIWGDLAHFKKPYTTTSPLTFSFPPRTTIAGMISAVIGLNKNEYPKYFRKQDAHIGLRILNPIKKMRFGQNLIDTKRSFLFSKIRQRTQIRFEYVKEPKYRVFFSHNDISLYKRAKGLLERHESVYTLAMGLSELLANYKFVGEFDLYEEQQNKDKVLINSLVPMYMSESLEIESGKAYFSESIPLEMDEQRIVTKFDNVLYERNGLPIQLTPQKYFRVSNGDVFLFL